MVVAKRRKAKLVTQCERCEVMRCRIMLQCSRLEFEAIADGCVYECPDFQNYWERLCA